MRKRSSLSRSRALHRSTALFEAMKSVREGDALVWGAAQSLSHWSVALERNVLRMAASSPFRSIRVIDDDIGARALIFSLAPIDLEPGLSQAGQRGAGGMGKPTHCVG
jgi:hypothetical protein